MRDFNLATIGLIIAMILVPFGTIFGAWHWYLSETTNAPATTGTVMISALTILLGVQFGLIFLTYDMSNRPMQPVFPFLEKIPTL